MNTKEYLSQALYLDLIIESKLEQLEALKCLATKVTSNITKEKVTNGNKSNRLLENTVIKIVDLENEINENIAHLVGLKKEIVDIINQVDDLNCRLILEKRYIAGESWEEISEELNYSVRGVYKVHGKALKKVERIKSVQ